MYAIYDQLGIVMDEYCSRAGNLLIVGNVGFGPRLEGMLPVLSLASTVGSGYW